MYRIDDVSGVITDAVYDEGTERLVVRRSQDVEPIIERNKAMANEGRKWDFGDDWGRLYARIPNIVIEQWMREDGVNVLALEGDDQGKYLRAKLNSSDYRDLKTDPGVY